MKSVIINITLSNPYIPIMYGWKDDGTLFITGIAGSIKYGVYCDANLFNQYLKGYLAMNLDAAIHDSIEIARTSGISYERMQQAACILAAEVERLREQLNQLNKDWCEEDEAIKQQALRVLDSKVVEGDSWYVPRGSALVELMANKLTD